MFGHMKAHQLLKIDTKSADQELGTLLKFTENAEPVRWIDFPNSILVLVTVPGEPDSGAFYVLERRTGTWFWLDFEDGQYSGYSASDFDLLLREYDFLSLVESPGLLRAKQGWLLEPGRPAEMAAPCK